jgi:hypothetical protein
MHEMGKGNLAIIFVVLVIFFTVCQKEFKLPATPIVTTAEVSNITTSTAFSGGRIVTQFPLISYGLCWSTKANPTINDNHTIDNLHLNSSFLIHITGLKAGTKYYVRAHATNTYGIGYGNEMSFTTQPK